MTDNEIIKALECCISQEGNCDICPQHSRTCVEDLLRFALDLINRQQAEIERLEEVKEQLESDVINANMNLEHMTVEVERLQKENNQFADIGKMYSEIKSEAIKEFAERLKNAKQYSLERHENIVPVAVIDWIVKEMVGEYE